MLRFFKFCFVLLVAGTAPLQAAVMPGTGCDTDYWSVLDARAWMEGKSDMEAAQTLISRPKSVMDVACFEGQLVNLHNAANRMFSDNKNSNRLFSNASRFPIDSYEPTIINHTYDDERGFHPSIGYAALSTTRLDNTLIRVIRTGLKRYFAPAFMPTAANPPATVCGSMSGIWSSAKCMNFNTASFRTFENLRGADPRTLPSACNSQRNKWATAMAAAYPAPAFPAASGGMDRAATFLSMLNPSNCAAGGGIPAIPTGVTIVKDGTAFADAVCSAPGCWYDPAGGGRCRP